MAGRMLMVGSGGLIIGGVVISTSSNPTAGELPRHLRASLAVSGGTLAQGRGSRRIQSTRASQLPATSGWPRARVHLPRMHL